jgi:hypothetical protein
VFLKLRQCHQFYLKFLKCLAFHGCDAFINGNVASNIVYDLKFTYKSTNSTSGCEKQNISNMPFAISKNSPSHSTLCADIFNLKSNLGLKSNRSFFFLHRGKYKLLGMYWVGSAVEAATCHVTKWMALRHASLGVRGLQSLEGQLQLNNG